jgi:hypothetical protein
MSITPLYLSNKIPNYTDYAGLPIMLIALRRKYIEKVATMLGFNLSGVGRVPLTAPQRIKLWSAKKTRRDGVSTRPEVSA